MRYQFRDVQHNLLILLIFHLLACSGNIYKGSDKARSDGDHLEAARIALDNKNYQLAEQELAEVEEATAEKSLLQAGTILGLGGFNIWDTVVQVLETMKSDGTRSGSGVDAYFNAIGNDVFGTGAEREARVTAINTAIITLAAAPDPSARDISNLSCFLTGIWALPVIEDASASVLGAQSALNSLATSVSGTGVTADECPNLGGFNTALAAVSIAQANFRSVLSRAAACDFLDLSKTSGQLNAVELKIDKFMANADKGCAAPTVSCTGSPYCEALKLGCVQNLVADPATPAGDKIVASCEIAQNCVGTSACF